MIGILVVLPSLFLSACAGGEPPPADQPAGGAAAVTAERPGPAAAEAPRKGGRDGETMDPSIYRGRELDGAALAVAVELRPELAGVLPPAFPDDIPLGNWLSIHSVRRLGETDFVLTCSTSYNRNAVIEFFVRQLPERGWKPVSHSSKPVLSVLAFRKDQRVVTVMVKKQVMNQDVSFDISYKQN